MIENIALSFQGVWSHKLRSFLTMLGIIIGIASIITIVSTIKGTNEQIKENLIGAGSNVVTVKLTQDGNEIDLSWSGLPEGVTVIDEDKRAELDKLDGIEETSLYRLRQYVNGVFYKNSAFSGDLYGVDSHFFSVNGYTLNYGRNFIERDFTKNHKVAIVDSRTATRLFEGTNPIGQTLEINSEPFTVVGVVSKSSTVSLQIYSYNDYMMYADTSAGSVFFRTIRNSSPPYRPAISPSRTF